MNAKERHKYILQLIAEKGAVTVAELCDLFEVSDMTIRRDLSILESADLVRRIYGGAISARGRSFEPPFMARAQESQLAKEAIGAYAAGLVNEGDSIALDVGTTTLQLARGLAKGRALTVITASLAIVNVLVDSPDVRVILAGGILRREEQSLTGAIAEATFQRFHVDKVFIGAAGVDLDVGLTEYNMDDARVKEHLIRSGQRRVLLVDSGKLGRRKFAAVAPLTEIHEIVTDDGIEPEYRAALGKMGITVHIVSVRDTNR
jgi:DeoR/GlpR family transcriptional regulator of sugar metabolism